jgi:hypothetical protein
VRYGDGGLRYGGGGGSGVNIRYAGGGESLDVRPIFAWDRGFIDAPVGSSSGPKDYIKNQIWAVFNAQPAVDRIVMVRASGSPFLLLRVKGAWFDVTGKPVVADVE